MRHQFVSCLIEEMRKNDKIFVITSDLGYGLFDNLKQEFPDRFVNIGSCEQLMIGMAVGMSYEGWIPICYSITPFAIYRPFEFIRNYLNHEMANVKIVGGGRNKDYHNLGFSHQAEDDMEIMKTFKNIQSFKPDDLSKDIIKLFLYNGLPSYINLVR
jgi:transketolase